MKKVKKPKLAGIGMEGEIVDSKLKAEWEKRLESEGMPEELPPALSEIISTSHSAVSAVRALAALKQHAGKLSFYEDLHKPFVSALSDRFGIGEGEAQELLDDAINFQQQEFLKRGAWSGPGDRMR